MTGPGLIEQVAAFAVRAAGEGLSASRRDAATRSILDTIGTMALGAAQPIRRMAIDAVSGWGAADAASVPGTPCRWPAPTAAFLNGTLAHCMDFDDTHLTSVLHPSSSVVPAVLAIAEVGGASGARVVDATAIGIEVCIRLGMAGYDRDQRNSIFFDRGQHATSMCGAIASAVAAATLLSDDPALVASAGGIAASMASGLLEANRSGGTVKRVHAGLAARDGVQAALLARAGITGPPTVLEGRFGFFSAFCGPDADPGRVVAGLGRSWYADELHIKPFPCNHFTHAGIEAALELRRRGVTGDRTVALELGVPGPVLRTIAEPPELKAAPPTGYAAAFSGPYTVAAALVGGGGLGLYVDDFTDRAARRPEVLALARRVRCYADPDCTKAFPERFPARLAARLIDGTTVVAEVPANLGGPERPLSDAQLDLKFALNAAHSYDPPAARRLAAEVRSLVLAGSVRPLCDALRDCAPVPRPSEEVDR